MSRVLIIGDTHCPCEHPNYMRFCKDLRDEWRCDTFVHIGDVVDFTSVSFHAKNPELPGPKDEYELALQCVKKWYKAFPKLTVTLGNHCERVFRKAASADIPAFFLRDYSEMWKTPGWGWVNDIIIDDVYYYHGVGSGGLYPAFNKARSMGMSVVSGHTHAAAGVWWTASPRHRFFGLNVGCGIDIEQLAFDYGKHYSRKPILSAGVVIDGIPYLEIMPCSIGEKYHRSKKW